MQFIVDRISGGKAVLESDNGVYLVTSLKSLPPDTREGTCLARRNNRFYIDAARETQRRKKLYAMLQHLKQKQNGE